MSVKYKHYSVLCMIFVTVALCDVLLVYRLVRIGAFVVTAGVFVMPLYYTLQDIVAEVYGYKKAQKMLIAMIVCMYVFSVIISIGIKLPYPVSWHYQEDYRFVLGHLFRTNSLGLLAVLFGAFLNIALVSRWKILARGRYYWFRCLCCSSVGECATAFLGSFYYITTFIPLMRYCLWFFLFVFC